MFPDSIPDTSWFNTWYFLIQYLILPDSISDTSWFNTWYFLIQYLILPDSISDTSWFNTWYFLIEHFPLSVDRIVIAEKFYYFQKAFSWTNYKCLVIVIDFWTPPTFFANEILTICLHEINICFALFQSLVRLRPCLFRALRLGQVRRLRDAARTGLGAS